MRQNTLAALQPAATGFMSMEHLSIDDVLKNRYIPSLEEDVAALQEATDIQAQIVGDLDEAARTEQITDNMLELADKTDSMPDVCTPVQAAIMDTASEMAVAGTSTNPDDVIPSMEAFIGKNLATEGFGDDLRKRAAEIWENIRRFVIEMWVRLKEAFKKIFFALPRTLARVKQLREELDSRKKNGGDPKKPTITILVGTASLSYNGYVVKTSKELNNGLHELSSLGKWAFKQYPQMVKVQGDIVSGALKSYQPEDAQKVLGDVVQKLSRANFNTVINNPNTGYLGDFELTTHRVDSKRIADLEDGRVLNALQASKIEVTQRVNGRMGMTAHSDREFATMDFTEMGNTLTNIEGLLKMIMSFEDSSEMKAMDKIHSDLMAGGEAAKNAFAKFASDEGNKSAQNFAEDVMKSLMNFNTTFTRWNTILTPVVIKKIVNTCRASLVLVDKSLAQY